MKTFKLPKDFFNKWIEALESKKYLQGRNNLFIEDTKNEFYCCLGVACRVANINKQFLKEYGLIHEIDKTITKNIPKELTEYESFRTTVSLPQLLANLNDGATYQDFINFKKWFPDIKFSKILTEDVAGKRLRYSFKDIAEFLKLNVEPYEW
jgi:hypothetical protein